MIHRYIIEATDEVKGFEEAIERLDREWGIEELEPCEDVISRKAAIDAMIKIEQDDIDQYGCSIPEGFNSDPAVEALNNLPLVTSQPKIGHWINLNENNDGHCDDYGNPYVKCSECDICNGTDQSDYCPNCGSKMESEINSRG